jgi:hypothetical protein
MLDPAAAVPAQEVKAQTVALRVYLIEQPRAQQHPLVGCHLDLEDRKLHALSIVLAGPGNAAQTPSTARRRDFHIVAHQHQHPLFPYQRRIGIEIAAQRAGEEARL